MDNEVLDMIEGWSERLTRIVIMLNRVPIPAKVGLEMERLQLDMRQAAWEIERDKDAMLRKQAESQIAEVA